MLDSKTDAIISEKSNKPINTLVLNTPIVVYINNTYHPNNYSSAIKIKSG